MCYLFFVLGLLHNPTHNTLCKWCIDCTNATVPKQQGQPSGVPPTKENCDLLWFTVISLTLALAGKMTMRRICAWHFYLSQAVTELALKTKCKQLTLTQGWMGFEVHHNTEYIYQHLRGDKCSPQYTTTWKQCFASVLSIMVMQSDCVVQKLLLFF